MPSKEGAISRDQKAKNLILNYSMIMMGLFEGVFTALASSMSEAMVAGASAMGEALSPGAQAASGTKPDADAGQEPQKVEAEVSKSVKKMLSEMRRETAAKMSAGEGSFTELTKDPRFDEGIRITESYNFGLPKLTEPLVDEDIAAYLELLGKEDAKVVKMFRELSEWQKSMPNPSTDKQ